MRRMMTNKKSESEINPASLIEIDFYGTKLKTEADRFDQLKTFLSLRGFDDKTACLKLKGGIKIVVDSQSKLEAARLESKNGVVRLEVSPLKRYSASQIPDITPTQAFSEIQINKNGNSIGQNERQEVEDAKMNVIEEFLKDPYLPTSSPIAKRSPRRFTQLDEEKRGGAEQVIMNAEMIRLIESGWFPCMVCYQDPSVSRICVECKGSREVKMDFEAFTMMKFINQNLSQMESNLKKKLDLNRGASSETKTSRQDINEIQARLTDHLSNEPNSQNDALNVTIKKPGNILLFRKERSEGQ